MRRKKNEKNGDDERKFLTIFLVIVIFLLVAVIVFLFLYVSSFMGETELSRTPPPLPQFIHYIPPSESPSFFTTSSSNDTPKPSTFQNSSSSTSSALGSVGFEEVEPDHRNPKAPFYHSKASPYKEKPLFPRRVAICYWGATRTLSETVKSHEKHIFTPLRDNELEYSVFIHKWHSQTAQQVWKTNVPIALEDDWKVLQPLDWKVEDQDEFKEKELDISKYYIQGEKNHKIWDKELLTNMVLALESLRRVTLLMLLSEEHFDAVIYVRPDALFFQDLPVQLLRLLNETSIVLPANHQYTGYNDRFAMGLLPHMCNYGLRIKQLQAYRATYGPIMSEKYLRFILDKHRFEVLISKEISFELCRPNENCNNQNGKQTPRSKRKTYAEKMQKAKEKLKNEPTERPKRTLN
mmetsp:Transcript_35902/g.56129  ORF Transcript_35902/g.56129 Transcript_35902/m.56129 type:complete len:407 (+) Transcript_35902:2277-3497(+)